MTVVLCLVLLALLVDQSDKPGITGAAYYMAIMFVALLALLSSGSVEWLPW